MLDREDVAPRLACFHAQQAAEKKALKALLIFGNTEPPRTHDLVVLRRLLPEDLDVGAGEEELAGLNRWPYRSATRATCRARV